MYQPYSKEEVTCNHIPLGNEFSNNSDKVVYVPFFEIARNMAPGDQKGRTGEMSTEQSQGTYRKTQLTLHTDILISQFQKYKIFV